MCDYKAGRRWRNRPPNHAVDDQMGMRRTSECVRSEIHITMERHEINPGKRVETTVHTEKMHLLEMVKKNTTWTNKENYAPETHKHKNDNTACHKTYLNDEINVCF